MGMFQNTQKITKIVFEPKSTHNFCPLGQLYCDKMAKNGSKPSLPHYTNHFKITFIPDTILCDYVDVEEWIHEKINDETLIIEDCVSMLFDYINDTYKPSYLKVESYVPDAVHGPVTIERETQNLKGRVINE